jgi:translation initiation factor 1A
MPNSIGGKGFKKGKKKKNNFREEKELILKDPKENENYGLVKGAKGNGRFDIETPDGTVKLGVLAGKHRKRMWINAGDIVLVGIWEFQEGKCSIIHKYSEEHVQKLVEKREILPNFQKDKFSHFSHDELEVDYFSTELPDEEQGEDEEEKDSKKEESSEEEEDFFVDVNDI